MDHSALTPQQFFYRIDGSVIGPATGIELRNAALAGNVIPSTLVANDPIGPWVAANRIRGLFDEGGRPLPHSPEPCNDPFTRAPAGSSTVGERWFIHLHDKEIGPLSAQELQQLAKQHIVVADTSVSVDRRNWRAASTVKDLQLINDSRDSHTSVNSTKSVLPSIVISKSFTAIGKKHDQKITRRKNLMSGLAWIGGLIMGTIALLNALNRFWRQ